MIEEPLQVNAADLEENSRARLGQKALTRRRRELFRLSIATKEGRELWYDHLFPAMGLFQPTGGRLEDVYAQAAIRNLALEFWAALEEHREYALQMQSEGLRRRDEVNAARRSARLTATSTGASTP